MPASSATNGGGPANALGLEGDTWTPPDQATPADADVADRYEPAAPELLEWTPERAGGIVKIGGYLLHTADPITSEPEAKELWRATEADVDAIAPPLARILNRYEPARRLAGVSDEAELAFGVIGYVRQNLATRGRAVTGKRQREAGELERDDGQVAGPATWPDGPGAPPPVL